MQGYIIHTQKVHNEDLIVWLLTPESIEKAYRFYGARHSNILLGYKIDFELRANLKFMPQLRNILHLGFSWLTDRQKLILWQRFMNLMYSHLNDAGSLDKIYFNCLENIASHIDKTDIKREIINAYVRILNTEGRLHEQMRCFICDGEISDAVSLVRGFLPSHKTCSYAHEFDKKMIEILFKEKNCTHIENNDISRLFDIILQGL